MRLSPLFLVLLHSLADARVLSVSGGRRPAQGPLRFRWAVPALGPLVCFMRGATARGRPDGPDEYPRTAITDHNNAGCTFREQWASHTPTL